jgi:hypothetical protein
VAYTEDSTQNFCSQKITGVGYTGESGLLGVGYTGESGLTGVGYTGESRLPGVAYTDESLAQPSRSANALKETVPLKKQIVSVKYWLMERNSCIENLSDLALSH